MEETKIITTEDGTLYETPKQTILKRLALIQSELKAPKDMKNEFGNYRYRNAEQIEELVKPLLVKYEMTLTITDHIEKIGERFYCRAAATVSEWESDDHITVSAYAREQEEKKGMDEAQIKGSASSYARKYALCGLFLIDDSKDDPDSKDNRSEGADKITKEQLAFITEHSQMIVDELKERNIKSSKALAKLNVNQASELVSLIETKLQNDNG